MILIDEIIKIDKLKKSDRKALASMVMSNNLAFKRYMTLCYGDYTTRHCFDRLNVKYRKTEAPLGMNYGTLESVYSKFASAVFDINNIEMTGDVANRRLIQIFEIISDEEVAFLKQVIKRKYSGFSKADFLAQ